MPARTATILPEIATDFFLNLFLSFLAQLPEKMGVSESLSFWVRPMGRRG